ncbi:DUF2384 domain-containing protein [Dyella amyloliquefaciens]|uniref:DUF2384 domain-containing protein n=1 Tax=Dyella amyloliquefaciens TaxID=1770545 RepID=UPI00102E5FEA|nr:DUF2384 domain-containing protein [Dyella amyloliquefaciens]
MNAGIARFRAVANEVDDVNSLRERVLLSSFMALEELCPHIAEMLIQNLGSRRKAALWMCRHQWALAGRNGYQTLADGEEDRLLDVVYGWEADLCSKGLVAE